MRFFNLNIRHLGYEREYRNAATYWLDKQQQAPIFYGCLSLADVRDKTENFCGKKSDWKKQQQTEILDFFNVERPTCVSIDDGHVWIYELIGPPQMSSAPAPLIDVKKPSSIDIPKYRAIRLLKKARISETPLVLASIKANRWMSSGTFREIKPVAENTYMGNIAAIRFMIDSWPADFRVDPLDCISSLEFETLVAKIFEEHGCFVPAYKGGFLRDIDLIVEPSRSFSIAQLQVTKTEKPLCLQLKMTVEPHLLESGYVNFAIGLNSDSSLRKFQDKNLPNAHLLLGRTWVRKALSQSPATQNWLERLIKWLPPQYRQISGLAS